MPPSFKWPLFCYKICLLPLYGVYIVECMSFFWLVCIFRVMLLYAVDKQIAPKHKINNFMIHECAENSLDPSDTHTQQIKAIHFYLRKKNRKDSERV